MKIKEMGLAWIVVNDLKKAIQFYTETVGLKLMEHSEEFGWAELQGHQGGAKLGIAQVCLKSEEDVQPGQNAVMTFTVDDLDKSLEEMQKKGVNLVGKVQDIPGHVKMQTVKDIDGNKFQIVQVYVHHCQHC